MFIRPKSVPVLLAGMWPALESKPETGTTVAILKKEGGPTLLSGYSDTLGEFHGRLPLSWVGKDVFVVIREVSFKYQYFNPVRVERWGLFLPVRQERDLVYNGTKGAKNLDPHRWASWDSTQENIKASRRINAAVRRAKLAWPMKWVGLSLTVLIGLGGFLVHPAAGLTLAVLVFFGMELLSNQLLLRGY